MDFIQPNTSFVVATADISSDFSGCTSNCNEFITLRSQLSYNISIYDLPIPVG